jgi:alkylhydroperoxidase/carboxymuconolactone decarboxylase family protein YurZ
MAEIPIEKLAEHIGGGLENLVRAAKLEIFSGVIMDTRVDTGRLRGNWQTTNGSPANGTIERVDASGASAIAEAQRNIKPDTVDWLTNNLPYSEVWEEKDRMVARNVARVERTIRNKARSL